MTAAGATEPVFAYGALQRPEVQLDILGRRVAGEPDALPGFRLEWRDAADPTSASPARPVIRRTGDARDRVFGTVLPLTIAELDAVDEYELARYRRISVQLAGGIRAWTYVGTA